MFCNNETENCLKGYEMLQKGFFLPNKPYLTKIYIKEQGEISLDFLQFNTN